MNNQTTQHAILQLAGHAISQLEDHARGAKLSARECDVLFSTLRDLLAHQCACQCECEPFQRESDLRLISAGPAANGGFECKIQSEKYVHYVAALLADYFKRNGGINYVTMRVTHPDTGPLVLSLQRVEGQTPHELRKEAEMELEQAMRYIGQLEALLQQHGIPLPEVAHTS